VPYATGNGPFTGLAGDVFHHQIVRADVVQGADAGVIERRDGPRLALEPAAELRFRNLDCDDAVEASIGCLVDLAHSSSADGFEDAIRA